MVEGIAVARAFHHQQLFFCGAGVVQRVHHVRVHKVVFRTVNEQHRHLGPGDLLQRGRLGKAVSCPKLTVLTHWHWDHTFGMHAVHGLCLANERTNQYLADFRKRLAAEGTAFFLGMDERIRREYSDNKPVIVSLADLVFRDEMLLDAGNCPIRVFQAEAPHTDDTTLVDVPGEKVLMLGDSTCGALPDWIKDQGLADKLAQTVREINPEICLLGHWTPLSAESIIQDLREVS